MIKEPRIIPECSSDTLLIELIRGRAVHRKGITKVTKAIKDDDNGHLPIVGVVDRDQFIRTDPIINQFMPQDSFKDIETEMLVLTKIPNTLKHIIFICPAFERWIWRCSELAQVDSSKWGYHDWQDLKKHSKAPTMEMLDAGYRKFIYAVVQKNPPPIATLRDWLNRILAVIPD